MPELNFSIVINLPANASEEEIAEAVKRRLKASVPAGCTYGEPTCSRVPAIPASYVESLPLVKLAKFRPRMFALLEEMARVQTRKAKEYATDEDPYSNYRIAGAAIGIPGSRYVEGRIAEKQARHVELLNNGRMATSEGGYVGSAIDRANCILIAVVMHEKESNEHEAAQS